MTSTIEELRAQRARQRLRQRARARRERARRRRRVTLLAALLAGGMLFVDAFVASAQDATRPSSGSRGVGVRVLETTTDLTRHLSRMPDERFGSGAPSHMWVIHVDDAVGYQHVIGVGAAMTDSSAWLIRTQLSAAARNALMANVFGPAGDHLTFLRVPMGASDFSAQGTPYTYDDLPPGETDPTLANFSVAHDESYIVPAIQQALALNRSLDILADPWTPPPWMKANDAFNNVDFAGTLLPQDYGPLAEYFVKFIQAYAQLGINVSAIAPQNEPRSPAGFPGMEFPETDEADFIQEFLAPALASAGLTTKIYGADTGFSATDYTNDLVSGPARSSLGGVAQHCYNGIPTRFSALHAMDPALDLVVSECAEELTPWSVPEIAIGSLRNWANAVALWNLALNPSGGPVEPPDSGCGPCRGLTVVNPKTGAVSYSLAFYQLGQISRWLERGAQVIKTEHFVNYFEKTSKLYGATSGLDDVAFRNPNGSLVVVAYNNSADYVHFAVEWHGSSFTYHLTPGATVSFLWRPPTSSTGGATSSTGGATTSPG